MHEQGRLKQRHYAVVLCALLACVAIASVAVARQAPDGAHDLTQQVRTCFPAAKWNGEDGYRPCIEVLRVEEDGSFRFRVSDAGGIDAPPTKRYVSGVGALDR